MLAAFFSCPEFLSRSHNERLLQAKPLSDDFVSSTAGGPWEIVLGLPKILASEKASKRRQRRLTMTSCPEAAVLEPSSLVPTE